LYPFYEKSTNLKLKVKIQYFLILYYAVAYIAKNKAVSFYCPITITYSFKSRYSDNLIYLLSSVIII